MIYLCLKGNLLPDCPLFSITKRAMLKMNKHLSTSAGWCEGAASAWYIWKHLCSPTLQESWVATRAWLFSSSPKMSPQDWGVRLTSAGDRKLQAILPQGCFVRRGGGRGGSAWGTHNGIHPAWRDHQRTGWPSYNPRGGKSWNPNLCGRAPVPPSYRYKREASQHCVSRV